MSRLSRVPPSAGRVVIDGKARFLSLLAQAAVWLRELRVSRTFLDRLRPRLFRPLIPNSRRCLHFCPRSGRFRLYELRVSRTFLDFLQLICSVHGYPTRRGIDGRPRRSTEVVVNEQSPFGRPWSPGEAPTVGDWETCGRRGRAGQETTARTSSMNPGGKKTCVNRNFAARRHRPGGRFPARRASRAACRAAKRRSVQIGRFRPSVRHRFCLGIPPSERRGGRRQSAGLAFEPTGVFT